MLTQGFITKELSFENLITCLPDSLFSENVKTWIILVIGCLPGVPKKRPVSEVISLSLTSIFYSSQAVPETLC